PTDNPARQASLGGNLTGKALSAGFARRSATLPSHTPHAAPGYRARHWTDDEAALPARSTPSGRHTPSGDPARQVSDSMSESAPKEGAKPVGRRGVRL